MNLTKEEALNKIKELKNYIENNNRVEWVEIGYNQIPRLFFDKYGIKPFKIMKRKKRNKKGKIWDDLNYFEAQEKAKEEGYRLLNIKEMLMLLDAYKQNKDYVDREDDNFLGIEELFYVDKGDIHLEWIFYLNNVASVRGGDWYDTNDEGVFALKLYDIPNSIENYIGFRYVCDIE